MAVRCPKAVTTRGIVTARPVPAVRLRAKWAGRATRIDRGDALLQRAALRSSTKPAPSSEPRRSAHAGRRPAQHQSATPASLDECRRRHDTDIQRLIARAADYKADRELQALDDEIPLSPLPRIRDRPSLRWGERAGVSAAEKAAAAAAQRAAAATEQEQREAALQTAAAAAHAAQLAAQAAARRRVRRHAARRSADDGERRPRRAPTWSPKPPPLPVAAPTAKRCARGGRCGGVATSRGVSDCVGARRRLPRRPPDARAAAIAPTAAHAAAAIAGGAIADDRRRRARTRVDAPMTPTPASC